MIRLGFLLFCLVGGCLCAQPAKNLKNKWFCSLLLQEKTVDFWLEQKPTRTFPPQYRIYNGAEIIDLNVNRMEGDTVVCPISIFDAELRFSYQIKDTIAGQYRKNDSKIPGYTLPFTGTRQPPKRLKPAPQAQDKQWAGEWLLTLTDENSKIDTGLALIRQSGDSLFGSILSETGDYRFLNGRFVGKEGYLQTFDGAHTYRFDLVRSGDKLSGIFVYSKTGSLTIAGRRTTRNPLSNGLTQNSGKENIPFGFSALGLDSIPVTHQLPTLKGKALVVQILGTWCPNCLDESRFLAEVYGQRPANVEFIGLAFERKPDFEYARNRVEVLKSRLNLPYPVWIAGIANRDSAAKALPALKGVMAFPTTVFVKANGSVYKVHTGFSGPATGRYYEAWKNEFNHLVTEISKP